MLIKFNKQMIQVVNEALMNYPYKYAAPVIDEINRQVTEIVNSQKQQKEPTTPGEGGDNNAEQ